MKTTLYLALALLPAIGCSSDDEAAPPTDPREAFVGNYTAEAHEYNFNLDDGTISKDTLIEVGAGATVEIKLLGEDLNKIALDLEELVQEQLSASPFFAGATANFPGNAVAVVMDTGFQLQNTYFEIASVDISFTTGFTGEGMLTEDGVLLEFTYSFFAPEFNLTFTFSGKVLLKKQQSENTL